MNIGTIPPTHPINVHINSGFACIKQGDGVRHGSLILLRPIQIEPLIELLQKAKSVIRQLESEHLTSEN